MASLGELFIELGVIGDKEEVEKFDKKVKELAKDMDLTLKKTVSTNKGITDFVKGIGAFVGAVTAAALAVNKFTNDLVESNQAMLDLTRTTDIAQETFQKWGSVGKMLGVDNAAQQLEGLNQKLFNLMLTGEGARGFQLAGINPIGQDANGVLEQLRSRVSGMDDTTATYLLQQMGIDPKMLHLLRLGREEFEALGETVRKYQLNRDQRKEIQALNVQLQIAAQKLQYLKDRAVLAIMPAWNKFVQSLARVTEGLERAVKYVTDFISKSPALQSAIKGIALALGVIFAIAQPLWATLVALYLIIDDIVGYFQGKDSLFGVAINALQDYIEELKEKFGENLTLDKVIPEVTLDVGRVIIKAGQVSFDMVEKELAKRFANGVPIPPVLAGLAALGGLAKGYAQYIKNLTEEGTATGGAASLGYLGTPPNFDRMLITPAAERAIADNRISYSYDQRQINMTNSIQSSQPVFDIQNQLAYARFAMNSGWA